MKTKKQNVQYTLYDTVVAILGFKDDLFVSANTYLCLKALEIDPEQIPEDIKSRVYYLDQSVRLPKPNSNGAKYGESALIAILNNGSLQKRKAEMDSDGHVIFSGFRSEGPSDLFFKESLDFSSDIYIVLEFTELLKYECNSMQCIALILNANFPKLINLLNEKKYKSTIILTEELQKTKTFIKKKDQFEDQLKNSGIRYVYETPSQQFKKEE